mmetsp:Transcript_22536/g.58831  ORF Transcript_22536/g.58831 Transcript_22536/m.58831 type:complete len:203 (-) Transcript_22536:1570-2178(-)
MSSCPPIECDATIDDFAAWAEQLFGADLGKKVPDLYAKPQEPFPLCENAFPGAPITNYIGAMRSAGDAAILCRTRDFLMTAAKNGGNGFLYLFTATPIMSLNMDHIPYMGSFHGAEVPFVFGFPAELSSGGERSLSKQMGCYWVNFASTGDPNYGPTSCEDLPKWPLVSSVSDGVALQFSNTSITVAPGLKKEQCDVFAQYP